MNDEQEKVQARIHSLGQQIRAHRIAQNLSQQRLALMVHTDQAVIARIEAGKHNTGIAKYIEIVDVCRFGQSCSSRAGGSYTSKSPGWQCNSRHKSSSSEIRIPFE